MTATHADPQTVQTIRELAGQPDRVRLTMRAKCDLWAENLAKEDVCDAICDWVDAGKSLRVVITEHVAEHKGKPQYEMLPQVREAKLLVKVTIVDLGEWQEKLLIVSSHRPNR